VEWKGDKVSAEENKAEENKAEENKAISRRADAELFDRWNFKVADELFASNFVYHDPLSGEDWHGPQSVKQYAAMMRAAFPDLYYTVEDQVAEGDKEVTRYAAGGTHQGELMGIAPTGERVEVTGISIMRINGGKIEEI
jgi:predicted ester cyclase